MSKIEVKRVGETDIHLEAEGPDLNVVLETVAPARRASARIEIESLYEDTVTTNYPVVEDEDGKLGFRSNRAVRAFFEAARDGRKYTPDDMWRDALAGCYFRDEVEDFYRLIGYTLCGFSEYAERKPAKHKPWTCDFGDIPERPA